MKIGVFAISILQQLMFGYCLMGILNGFEKIHMKTWHNIPNASFKNGFVTALKLYFKTTEKVSGTSQVDLYLLEVLFSERLILDVLKDQSCFYGIISM